MQNVYIKICLTVSTWKAEIPMVDNIIDELGCFLQDVKIWAVLKSFRSSVSLSS
jgi:hypothetical protein